MILVIRRYMGILYIGSLITLELYIILLSLLLIKYKYNIIIFLYLLEKTLGIMKRIIIFISWKMKSREILLQNN